MRPGASWGCLPSTLQALPALGTFARCGASGERARPAQAGEGRPADEPWARTSDRAVWRAYKTGLVLTVTRLAGDGWQAVVEGNGVTERSPAPLPTRLAAQRWADSRAGGAR